MCLLSPPRAGAEGGCRVSTPNDGGPAFPLQEQLQCGPGDSGWLSPKQEGMSLRDYFAGQALIGILASVQWTKEAAECAEDMPPDGVVSPVDYAVAISAYEIADAMLKARAQTGAA